jgi:predicted nucleic acid-binding protein
VILVDTSAWVELDRASGSSTHLRLRRAIEEDEPLATTGIVVLELLAGARDETHVRDVRRLLARCSFLALDESADYEAAAALYRLCRRGGETVRRIEDCLIAAVAIRTGSELLQRDADYDAIARHAPLTLTA